jgi:hypothetical protein
MATDALSEHGKARYFGPISSLPWPLRHVFQINFLSFSAESLYIFTCYTGVIQELSERSEQKK